MNVESPHTPATRPQPRPRLTGAQATLLRQYEGQIASASTWDRLTAISDSLDRCWLHRALPEPACEALLDQIEAKAKEIVP